MKKNELKVYLLAILYFGLDLISKVLVLKSGNVLFNKVVIEDFFSITLTKNTGAAFSFLEGYTWIFIILGLVAIFFVIKTFIHKKELNKLEIVSYSLLLGGIFGNLVDRIINGYVVDFLSFKIFGYYFPVFNLADAFIVIGAILMIIEIVRGVVNENRSKK